MKVWHGSLDLRARRAPPTISASDIADGQIMMASRSSARSKSGLSLIEDEYWYAGSLSERKAEIILTKLGEPGCFLVRDSLLPEADYVLSVNSGKDIWHYDIQILPSNACIFNGYTFTSLPDAVVFYSENRLGSVFLKEPEEPIVSEAQLKSFGPSVIKATAAPGSSNPPRTSPFVFTESTTATTTTQALTSSPQTRRLIAPESLRPPSPRTPPATSARGDYHTSSPLQTRKLGAPESIKPPHRMQFVSVDTQANASPQLQYRHIAQPEPQLPDREIANDNTTNLVPLSALPKTAGLSGGDGWLETHSGAGSQVSLGSHSPKPQSVQRFVVDLEESQTGTSQISSQASEVDCSYITPSKEAEPVFITSGYMYIAPPVSEFDSTSPDGEKKDKQPLIQKGENSPKGERSRGEAGTKAEICETQFDSSGDPTTAILDTPSSAESTPVRHVSSLATTAGHTTTESRREGGLAANKSSPNPPKEDDSREKEEESRKSSSGNSEPDDIKQLPLIASRRSAFEQRAQVSKERNNQNSTSKPAKKPPAIPKRVSSIPKLENGQSGGDQNATNTDKLTVTSTGPLQEENKRVAEAEELMPPPPPMSTHPGVVAKIPAAVEEPLVHSDKQQQEENESIKEEEPKLKIVEQEKKEEDEPVRDLEESKPEVELRDSSKLRPVPKERQMLISVPAVKPKETEAEQDSSTEPSEGVKSTPLSPVIEPSTEVTSMSNDKPAAPPQDEVDGMNVDDNNAISDSKEIAKSEGDSMSSFGHTASPTKSDLPTVAISSEQSAGKERTTLDDIDPSKKIGAEVSTFKPIPKPRSTHHLSASFESSAAQAPTISISKDKAPHPPKLRLRNIAAPRSPPPTYTPEMKRSSAYYPTPVNREFLLRAQSMSVLPTTGSASPRMVARGEQRQQMPPGFMIFSRSQEAVVGHGQHATLTSNLMRRTIQVNKKGDGEQAGLAPPPAAAPMNTKRSSTKKRRSLFRRK